MATADRTLMLKLIADVNQPTKAVKGLGGSLRKMGSAAKSWGKAFTGALVIGGIEKVVDSLGEAMEAFKDEQDVTRGLQQTWKNLGRDADQLGGVIDRLGGRAVNLGFDDAEVLRSFNTFLTKTGSVKDAQQGVNAAMNLARARGISYARAVKIVTGSLGELGPELKRNRRQAERWARNHPLEVAVGKITDEWANFVGFFSQGKINKAFAALGNIGTAVTDLLFGTADKSGKRSGGLIDRFTEIGRKAVPAIITGLGDLGNQLGLAFTTAVQAVDWGKTITDTVNAALGLLTSADFTGLGILAVTLATGLFVVDVFANAATTMFKAPALLANAALKTAVFALGKALNLTLKIAMFTGQLAIDAMARGLTFLVNSIPTGADSTIGKAARGLGAGIQKMIILGVTVGLLLTLQDQINDILDQLGVPRLKSGPGGLVFNPDTGKWERRASGGYTHGGMTLVGEQGPELVKLPYGSRVYSAGQSAAMMSGWGGVTINITAGVGNPVEIGREVDRVLRAYRGRAGIPA